MKLQSLKNALKDLGLEITTFSKDSNREDLYRIHTIGESSKVVATISQNVPFRLSTNHKQFDTFSHKKTLLYLISTFASTPVNDRGDCQTYELRMNGLNSERNILMYTKKSTTRHEKGEYFFGGNNMSVNDVHYQRTFTANELDNLPQTFKSMVLNGHLEITVRNK